MMLAQVLEALRPQSPGIYLDGTLGAGGHAEAVLQASGPAGKLIGFDRDPQALKIARDRLSGFGGRFTAHHTTFDQMGDCLAQDAPSGAQGILLDLGVSSMQLDHKERGFSFMADADLDMRMGPGGESAADLLARIELKELIGILGLYGEEPFARRIASALIEGREQKAITGTARLASLVEAALPAKARRTRKRHPATRTFQALRIAVNDELGMLERFLDRVPGWLAPGGRLCIISYHSLEDRMVKRCLRTWADPCTCPPRLPVCACGKKPLFTLLGKKAQKPAAEEIVDNPRARSARLRGAVRTEESV